jgi:hypothetical protein
VKDSLMPLVIVALLALCVICACTPSCSVKPALINWERRETPWFHWRKKPEPVKGVQE